MTPLALVTGASRGIGACVAAQLRALGWDVLAPTRANLDFGGRYPMVLKDYGILSDELVPDVTKLDAAIFCHGTWYSRPRQWGSDFIHQLVERVTIPNELLDWLWAFLQPVGCVVMVSSTQAFGGRAETGPYGAACAAQVRLIQGLAASKDGVRYNAVCPGLTATDMAAQVVASGDCRPDAVPQPPEAVAAAVVGLVLDGVSNGRVLRVVDGQVSEARWSW